MSGLQFKAKLHDPKTASREELLNQISEITKHLVIVAEDFEKKIFTVYDHERLVERLCELSEAQRDAWDRSDMHALFENGKEAQAVAKRIKDDVLSILHSLEMMIDEKDVSLELLKVEGASLVALKRHVLEDFEIEKREYQLLFSAAKDKLGSEVAKVRGELEMEARIMGIHDRLVELLGNLKPLVDRLKSLIGREIGVVLELPYREGIKFDAFETQHKEGLLKTFVQQVRENLIQQKKYFYDPFNELARKDASPVDALEKMIAGKARGNRMTAEDFRRVLATLTEPEERIVLASAILGNQRMYSGGELDIFEADVYRLAKELLVNARKGVKEIKERATHDMMMRIKNKMSFDGDIRHVIKDRKTFTLIMIDIDHFKQFNDTYGHDIGDKVLIEVAEILKGGIRKKKDDVYRVGGEEIAIILQETDLEGGLIIAERLRKSVESHKMMNHRGEEIRSITISSGVVTLEGDSYEQAAAMKLENNEIAKRMIKQADVLLYEAKQSGRNVVMKSLFNPLLNPTTK